MPLFRSGGQAQYVDMPIAAPDGDALVARRAGYDSNATMRAQFATRLKTSPRAYRRTFRATETQSTKSSDGSIATLP
jgi:hypothetical protein